MVLLLRANVRTVCAVFHRAGCAIFVPIFLTRTSLSIRIESIWQQSRLWPKSQKSEEERQEYLNKHGMGSPRSANIKVLQAPSVRIGCAALLITTSSMCPTCSPLIFHSNPKTLKSRKTITIDEVLSFNSMDELVATIAEQKVHQLSYGAWPDYRTPLRSGSISPCLLSSPSWLWRGDLSKFATCSCIIAGWSARYLRHAWLRWRRCSAKSLMLVMRRRYLRLQYSPGP